MDMDTSNASPFAISSLRRASVLAQLKTLRDCLNLQRPTTGVFVRNGRVHTIEWRDTGRVDGPVVTMNDTDQILRDLAEVL